MELKFYRCSICGKVVAMIKGTAVPTMCCGKAMTELVPGVADASVEKHVPQVQVDGSRVVVSVGEQAHPMIPEHYIEWIALETNKGNQIRSLAPNQEPRATFALEEGEEVVAAYAYCNLHMLWKGR